MAWTKNGKKIGNKWTNKKSGKKNTKRVTRYQGPPTFRPQTFLRTGFPKTTSVTLKYCDGFIMNPSAITVDHYYFRANSIFDPDLSGTGHQPLGRDQWALFYNHYIVSKARMKLTITNQTIADNGGIIGGIQLVATNSFLSNDIRAFMEQPTTSYKVCNNSLSGGAGNGLVIYKTYDCKTYNNITNVPDNVSNHGAPMGNNPTEDVIFMCFLGINPVSLVDPEKHYCVVEIEYDVIFSEPKEIAQS